MQNALRQEAFANSRQCPRFNAASAAGQACYSEKAKALPILLRDIDAALLANAG